MSGCTPSPILPTADAQTYPRRDRTVLHGLIGNCAVGSARLIANADLQKAWAAAAAMSVPLNMVGVSLPAAIAAITVDCISSARQAVPVAETLFRKKTR